MEKPFLVETSTMIIDSKGVVYEKDNSKWFPLNNEEDGKAILKYINILIPGKYYKLGNWHKSSILLQERAFVEIEKDDFNINYWNYFKYVLPISSCKECGSEIKVRVCPHCGEWN